MNNTGMIRKIDDLGRIVIPKEIRQNLRIDAGDDLEIICTGKTIELRKFSYNKSNEQKINEILNILPDHEGIVLTTDREKVINSCIYHQYLLPQKLRELIFESKEYKSSVLDSFTLNDINVKGFFYVVPIIINSFCNGLVIFINNKAITKSDELLVNIIKRLIENIN